jgi:hypothetical protein
MIQWPGDYYGGDLKQTKQAVIAEKNQVLP